MNVNDILNAKEKTTPRKKATSEELLKQIKVEPSNGEINDFEKALLSNLLCKHKSLKMKLVNTNKAGWSGERQFNEVVLPHIESIEELLEDFTKQGN